MTLSNGSTILPADIEGVYTPALANVRNINTFKNFTNYKQFVESYTWRNIDNTTAEYLRTFVWTPRTDCTLRAIRVSCNGTAGVTATVTIPAQVIEDNTIVGGNILNNISLSATSAATIQASTGLYELPNDKLFGFLAGDSIDFVATINSATNVDVTITLLLENVITSK